MFEVRLASLDDKALKDLPSPKEGESFFITLHPGYLEKSQYNVFSVDQSSENFKELLKSVELVGIKDSVLARLKPEDGLEILSGQRRHLAASAISFLKPDNQEKVLHLSDPAYKPTNVNADLKWTSFHTAWQ